MKSTTTLMLLGCLILAAIAACLFVSKASSTNWASLRSIRHACGLHSGILRVNALTDGIHPDGIIGHLLADAALTTRYLLVKSGSDAAHFAACGASDKPLGVCLDEPEAAESEAAIFFLGAGKGTVLMVASEAIAAGADVYAAASGKVQDEPGSAGTYYMVGRAVTAAGADGDILEVVPCLPQLTKVVANASTLAQTQAAMVNGAIVIVLGA
jgi:hypothetical protein